MADKPSKGLADVAAAASTALSDIDGRAGRGPANLASAGQR